jgi:hypothetical protein
MAIRRDILARRRWAAFAALGFVITGLSACTGLDSETACPAVAKLPDADRLTRFDGTGHDLIDVAFEARIGEIASECDYGDSGYDVLSKVQFLGTRGPSTAATQAGFGYFVAIVDSTGAVLARQEFDSNFQFEAKTRSGVVEELEQQIPPSSGTAPYTIYVGFQLSPEELAFNRGKVR